MVPHRQAHVVLAIYKASDHGDCLPGYNFSDEHNASSVFFTFLATNAEAEVYLIEIRMKWDRKGPKEFGAAKSKADEANVCFS